MVLELSLFLVSKMKNMGQKQMKDGIMLYCLFMIWLTECFWINICLLKCWNIKNRWLIFFSFPELLVGCLCSIIYATHVVELLFWPLRSCQLCYFWQKPEISIVKHMVKLCQSVCGRLWCYSVCNSGYSHDNRKQRWKTPATTVAPV